MINQIYLTELQVIKAKSSDTDAPFLFVFIDINWYMVFKNYDV